MRAVLSRAFAGLLLLGALLPAGGLRADPPREGPASEADGNARESDSGDGQEEGRRRAEAAPPSGTRVLTRAEKKCRQNQGCTNPAAPCRPCDR
jgi:hypothetical protein